MKCYVCGHEIFDVYLKTTSTIEVVDTIVNKIPYYHSDAIILIETIFCDKCGVMQYCAAAKDPWFTNQVSLVWDEEKQMLVDKKKVDLTNSTITSEELTKLLREYVNHGGNLDEITKKKEEK